MLCASMAITRVPCSSPGPIVSRQVEHIDVQYHYARELKEEVIDIRYTPTEEMAS